MKKAKRMVNKTAARIHRNLPTDPARALDALKSIASMPWKGESRQDLRLAAKVIRKAVGDVDQVTKQELRQLARSRGNQRLFRNIF